MTKEVEQSISKSDWKQEFETLREIIMDCPVTEELKWNLPCYTDGGKNIVLIQGFKEYCALLFFKGALLKDEQHLLIQQTENVQSARQMRFTNVEDILAVENAIRDYVLEAMEVEKAGLKVEKKKTYEIPDELEMKFDEDPAFKEAFESLTPGRQRAYILHFSKAKKTETRTSRIEKYMPDIFAGKGMND
ncbi:YdeI/OmpD-associated family protein [Halobacillus salinus]|uniref:YdeI/OmpD-associated family protein n=1 Tax=Halobacillus salinus TaxID=192814 RepID=UPI0009A5CC44|nr:YdeI/OmpD-associated family protein [Halobacillus salinus]